MELSIDKAYHISAAGVIHETAPADGRAFTLGEVQNVVDGYIEIVHLDDERIMIINEEGKFGKPYNPIATDVAHIFRAIIVNDYICGDVVVCPSYMLP